MTARVLLARHASHDEVGRVLSGRSDIALNAVGQAEASALAGLLKTRGIRRIHSSPRRRACETAQIVAERLRLKVEVADPLDEIDFGDWTGQSFAALDNRDEWRHWNARRGGARCPNGETMGEAVARAWRYIERLAMGEETVLCVSHCDVIRGVAGRAIGLDFDNLLRFDCAPASVSELAVGDGWSRLVSLNERAA